MKSLLFLCLILPACTVRPTIRSGDQLVTLGGSIFTKSSSETASYSGPLGTMSYADFGKDETVIPGKIINYYGIKAAVDATTASMRAKESTTRVLGQQDVQKQTIQSAERVESLKILNPVEEAIPAAVIPPP